MVKRKGGQSRSGWVLEGFWSGAFQTEAVLSAKGRGAGVGCCASLGSRVPPAMPF